jgi:AraC-like DNA-binding protein
MGVIATLLPTATHLQRLRTAIRDRHQVIACDEWSLLLHACERQAVRVAVLDLFAGGHANFDRVRQLKQRLPRLTLIAYVTFVPDRAHDLFDAGRQGMDGLVIAEQDDSPRSLLSLIERAESRSLGALVRAALDDVDATTRDAVLLAVTRAHERLSPEGLSRLLALPRRTVSERLANAGFPPPQRLLSWGRLIVAAHLLEDRHRSADRIAVALDFPSGSALRNTCQRYLSSTPSEIREQGGATFVLRALLQEVNAPEKALALVMERGDA